MICLGLIIQANKLLNWAHEQCSASRARFGVRPDNQISAS